MSWQNTSSRRETQERLMDGRDIRHMIHRIRLDTLADTAQCLIQKTTLTSHKGTFQWMKNIHFLWQNQESGNRFFSGTSQESQVRLWLLSKVRRYRAGNSYLINCTLVYSKASPCKCQLPTRLTAWQSISGHDAVPILCTCQAFSGRWELLLTPWWADSCVTKSTDIVIMPRPLVWDVYCSSVS